MVNKVLKPSTVNELLHQLQTRKKKTDTASLWEPPAVLQRQLLLLELLATFIFYFSKKITGCLGCSIGQSCLLPRKQTPASSPSLSPESCAGFTSPLLGPGRSRQREGMARSVPSAQPAPHGTGLCTQHGKGLQGAGTPQQAFWPHYCMFCRRPWTPLSSSWVMMRWKSWPATADIHQQPLLEGLLCCGNAALPATV